MEKYIITLDSGTTSCRTLVVNHEGKIIANSQTEFTQMFPQSGWVEHDPLEIWNTQLSTMQSAKHKAKIKSIDIAALGITNQRETIVLWDKETGLPVYNAIVWQDRRTSEYCDLLVEQGYSDMFTKKTGLIINPYFSGTKIRWILQNVPEAKLKYEEGVLLAGTIDTWLMWKLTDGKVHATDVSNASRTLLFNIHTLEWDQEILDLLEIPKDILPEVKSSSELYGYVKPTHWSNKAVGEVPITGVAGDQQSALFGQMCTEVGMVKNTYGTGCFTLVNTGHEPIKSKNKLLTTIAWKIGKEKTVYALEGSVFIAGAAIKWLRDSIRIIYDSAESDFFASLVDDDQRVYIVPSFTGLGAPYWDSHSRGAIFGLERGTKREHIIKAALDSIAYQSNDLIYAMQKDLGKPIILLKVDGGASKSNYLMQFQSSITNINVERPTNTETTGMGASYLAGLAVGYWKDIDELKKLNMPDKVFVPKIEEKQRQSLLKGWNTAVSKTLNWTNDIEI
ncbi:glycerol kinase GlpK [Mycoplasma phocimorsus]|uniref:Glycerol kinase n=1 Tax=Mycoplasma phocimorsus TaxID=3045839 RepID=A0AAJ1PSS2_9MOLU|nr:glycerol kinase GlpK [Mycoplasma phocimorsus]MDJ1646058.1 glycerol kinase GlpK [Mycoplasma phocimorsus]MDJ1646362.1 glycerol kinase GlpK [Mycoplasma phocimorsus]MDJ1647073.1 glycerol kinase GlpK [Mycoplasma phocimorsus]MDJ1647513.1 glycerol kinase GlpK [Mycoplasma phocimorsus]MDJ1649158.1 glycerol kinase GlpK [Mycoplasma phocimorsus]